MITIEATQTSGGYYSARHEDRTLVKRTHTPLLTSARVLLSEGYDPATPIQMKHKGSDVVSLRSTIGRAAALSVRETTSAPRFVRYAPPSSSLRSAVVQVLAQDRPNVDRLPA